MCNDINSIIRMFTSSDKAGKSEKKIDTYLEYNKLGEYLNGSTFVKKGGENLTISERNVLVNLYNQAKTFITNKYINCKKDIVINSDNAKEYARIFEELEYKYNWDELDEAGEKEFDAIKKALYDFCIESEYNTEDLLSTDYKTLNYDHIIKQILKRNQIEAEMIEKGEVVLERIKNPYNNNLLKEAVKTRIANENIQPLDKQNYTSDLGNGEFDKVATQKTELCWAHAGINSLLQTEEGKSLLSSNTYYDETTGVFAIHLQEAEDNGLHGGIYVITPEEIETEGKNLSSGEGDITAWMIAIKRYFEEMQAKPELIEETGKNKDFFMDVEKGNAQFRFFELITGAESSRKNLLNNTRLQIGVSYGKNDITFTDIKDLVTNKKGAAIVVLANHAMSVVGIRDDKLLIQESNQSENIGEEFFDKKQNHTLFVKTEPINGMPTYELSAHDFEHYNFGEAVIKWK